MHEPKFIVTIGASAGGLQAVTELIAQLQEDADAAVLVVLHVTYTAFGSTLISRLQRHTTFTCKFAEDGEPIASRHVYLAVPDQHLLVKQGKIFLGRGAVENRWRPSIDALFRSAAVAYTSRVIGVILSGMMEDGVTGMQFISQCGGTCIVQDPQEAEYPDLPKAVMRYVKTDYCTTLARIAIILQEKMRNGNGTPTPVPEQLKKEAEIAERVVAGIESLTNLGGDLSPYSCPDCGGSLWELRNGDVLRYRCHTGHMYTSDQLLEKKREELENTFWVVIRILEERKNLLRKMGEEEQSKGWSMSAASKRERANELQVHIGRIKDVLFGSTADHDPNDDELNGR